MVNNQNESLGQLLYEFTQIAQEIDQEEDNEESN